METIVRFKYLIVALLGLIFLLLTHIGQLAAGDYGALLKDITAKVSDEIWIALFISIIIGFLLETAARYKLNTIIENYLDKSDKMHNDEILIIEGISHKLLSENNRIMRETEKAITRSQESMFEAAFRKSIPQNVFDAVNRTVFARKFYRTNDQTTWRLRMSPLSEQPMLIAHIDSSYTLINLTGSEEEYIIRHEIERCSEPPDGSPIKLIQVNGEEKDLSLLTRLPGSSGDHNVYYELPPINVPGRGHVTVTSQYELLRKLEDREIWYTLDAADGMDVRVYDPDDCVRIDGEFRVAPIGNAQVQVTRSEKSVALRVIGTILPFQGLIFSWKYEKGRRA